MPANKQTDSGRVWRLMIEVEAMNSCNGLDLGQKGFTNVFVRGDDAQSCKALLLGTLTGMGLHLVRVRECALCRIPRSKERRLKEHVRLAGIARDTGKLVFGDLHTWDNQG